MADQDDITEVEFGGDAGPRIRRREDHIEAYANSAQIKAMLFDFVIDFGLLQPNTEGPTEVMNFFAVRMSPQHAKVFLGLLAKQVAAYEAAYGTIITEAVTRKEPDATREAAEADPTS